jgi:serine/threonine-protein kinase HSL1, negative regulator of Swe1 kinase
MGVILYAMLAGHLPFENQNIDILLQTIMRGQYKMSPRFTDAASDFIRRILVVNPKHRLNMMQMWNQPLITKYDYLDNLRENGGQPSSVRRSLKQSPIPAAHVDPQILRQLRALWHTFSEDGIRKHLSSQEHTEQKVFYWLLHGYRERQLEEFNPHLTHSKSDFHHMKPPNWSTRVSTCQFAQPVAGSSRRSVSRFTVISTVADTDDGTIRSYDPYNASQFQFEGHASQAKVTVHRNGTRSSAGRHRTGSVSHSFRSFGSAQGAKPQRKRLASSSSTATGRPYSTRGSLSSIQSSQQGGGPHVRAHLHHKRGVDFSSVRKRTQVAHQVGSKRARRGSASTAGDVATYHRNDHAYTSSSKKARRESAAKQTHALRQSQSAIEEPAWQKELRDFSHRIAQDLDDAFNSSLLAAPSVASPGTNRTETPLSLHLNAAGDEASPAGTARTVETPIEPLQAATDWETRPLPPLPNEKDTVARRSKPLAWPLPGEQGTVDSYPVAREIHVGANGVAVPAVAAIVSERRIVSAPVYSQYARETRRPLPAITEDTPDTKQKHVTQRKARITSAPAAGSPRTRNDEAADLVNLASAKETIRVVHSPTPIRYNDLVQVPEPLRLRKKSTVHIAPARFADSGGQSPTAPDLRPQSASLDAEQKRNSAGSMLGEEPVVPAAKEKKASWFRRGSRENSQNGILPAESSQKSKSGNIFGRNKSQVDIPTSATSSSGKEARKKSFQFPFWRNSKDTPRLSIAGQRPLATFPSTVRWANHYRYRSRSR